MNRTNRKLCGILLLLAVASVSGVPMNRFQEEGPEYQESHESQGEYGGEQGAGETASVASIPNVPMPKVSSLPSGEEAASFLGLPSGAANLLGGLMSNKAEESKGAVKGTGVKLGKETSITVTTKKDLELFSLKGIGEWVKYIFNPWEMVKKISEHFNLPPEKVKEKLGGNGLLSNPKNFLEPLSVNFGILQKVFKNDNCRQRLFCQMGSYLKPLKEPMSKFSSSVPSIGDQLTDMSRVMFDSDCEKDFPECTPLLKKPFLELTKEPSKE